MAKAQLKTTKNNLSATDFINSIKDEDQRKDAKAISAMMKAATKSSPKMWGSAIIGFGNRTLKYASGRELDWMMIGFSPHKDSNVLYLTGDISKQKDILKQLGKVKTSKACLYIRSLADVDQKVLKKIIAQSVAEARKAKA